MTDRKLAGRRLEDIRPQRREPEPADPFAAIRGAEVNVADDGETLIVKHPDGTIERMPRWP